MLTLLARTAFILAIVAVAACGGSNPAPDSTSSQPLDVDPETARTWEGWAEEAQQIATTTATIYRSGGMLPSQAEEQQERAGTLAGEIRSAEPSSELVLSLADDLDAVVAGLQFALEYAESAGFRVIRIVIPSLDDALDQLAEDSAALTEALDAP